MNRLEVLGWWFHERVPDAYPLPQRLVAPWRGTAREVVVAYLRGGACMVRYPSRSWCRFACGERGMGQRDLTDGTFVWPDGLAHYVERHDVHLPEHFVVRALAQRGMVADFVLPEPAFGLYDTGPWLRWGRARGACLDLDGWMPPTPATARRLARELRVARGAHLVLCRAEPREVVVALASGALAVHALPPSSRPVRHLAGWHEWPRAP